MPPAPTNPIPDPPPHGAANPALPPNVLLIGLRSAGKTIVADLCGRLLNRPAVDLDAVTCALLGEPCIATAWRNRGIAAFRLAETAALRRVVQLPGQIIACGGGTPTAPGAADLIRAAARERRVITVYLRAPVPVLRARMSLTDPSLRPSVTGADPLHEIDVLFAHRDPLYLTLADHVLETALLTPPQTAEQIARILQ